MAEKLGNTLADQMESIMRYFEKSDAYFAGNPENSGDLYAAMDAYFKMYLSSIDPETGNRAGAFSIRLKKRIDTLYRESLPAIFKALEEKATNNGETIRRSSKAGRYAKMLFDLQDNTQAIGGHYGYLECAKPTKPVGGDEMSLEQLMQQMPVQDTMRK
jgi:hypothetical protein